MTFPSPPFPVSRLRRLRRTPALRRLVAETRLGVGDLIAPLFIKEGLREPGAISSLPGHVQHTLESVRREATELAELGVGGVLLFGVPAVKDGEGTQAWAPEGIVQQALRALRAELGEALVVIADLCLDEFTDHGHCGVLDSRRDVDNDATLARYARVAVAQAEAGATIVAPSGMMDGQVGVIRAALDGAGHADVAILAYAAKYASALYGPFREAAEGAPQFGDRAGYQMDPANGDEALREVALDVAEGADALLVKPAGSYLDVCWRIKQEFGLPVAAYQVSGEYAMVKAAAERGWIDGDRTLLELLVSIRRAGADMIVTYAAREAAGLLARR